MPRIRYIGIALLLAVAVIRGDVTIDLSRNHVATLFLIGVNTTTEECPHTVSDLFPMARIRLIPSTDSWGTDWTLRGDDERKGELGLVTIHNTNTKRICDTRRRYFHLSETSIPSITIINTCLNCNDDIVSLANALELKRNQYISMDASFAYSTESSSGMQRAKANILSLKRGEVGVLDSSLSLRLKLGNGSENAGEESANSGDGSGSSSQSQKPGFIRSSLNARIKTTPDVVNNQTSPFLGIEKSSIDRSIQDESVGARANHNRPNSCSTSFDECCGDTDCISGNICIARTCIDKGSPRFTLSWIGDDDLDLYVVTPGGVTLSYNKLEDPISGGRVGESVDQMGPGYHVENIFFPDGPFGVYEYYVRPLTTVGTFDNWKLTVNDERGTVIEHVGSRFSPVFSYERLQAGLTSPPLSIPTLRPSQLPAGALTQPPFVESCNPSIDECCSASDCLFRGEICFNRNCIDDGNPRITLSWVGNDDLDLFVESPAGTELSFSNFFDPISGGRFGEKIDQSGNGHYVENVYFPEEGGPAGNYRFFVRPSSTVGMADAWTVTVVDNGKTVFSQSGIGASDRFLYSRDRNQPSPMLPATAPVLMPSSPPIRGLPSRQPTLGRPTGPPSRSPQADRDCNSFFDECCETSDCRTSRDVCEQRTCIRDGNPRISLLWEGDDDLDVYVITPDGVEISASNTFDMFSGARFEMDPNQDMTGKHIENVYFPVLGTPIGRYAYGVRSSKTILSPDGWVLEVYEDGELVDSRSGSGTSSQFEYNRVQAFDGPQRPRPSPPRCSPISDECCLDSDCGDESQVCVQRSCISEGNPRISLTWIGDDDLSLFVQTPDGTALTNSEPFDPSTGGRLEQSSPQDSYGFHVESVSFPAGRAPPGGYKYTVRSTTTRGVGADVWKISVYEDGKEVEEQTGIGDSRQFIYQRLQGTPVASPTFQAPTLAPFATTVCSLANHECCGDANCPSGEVCQNRNCANDGNPRVTLTRTGDDDFDLYVRTPNGDVIFYGNRFDQKTGGIFGEEAIQAGNGFHMENVYFPGIGGPRGVYSASVRLASRRGIADVWTLRIYDGDALQVSKTGTGDSFFASYDKGGIPPPLVPSPPASPVPQAPVTERPPPGQPPFENPRECPYECCSDAECPLPGELCVQRQCILDGTPRFTLTWTGNDDLSLIVITPQGNTISYLNPSDAVSGGVFGEDSNQSEFGFHVENIVFPSRDGGPVGQYSYLVQSANIRGSPDRWALRVFVNDELVALQTGTGASRTYTYNFGGATPTAPLPQPSSSPVVVAPVATRAPAEPPTSSFCLTSLNCERNREVCVQETCIGEGTPRFTLVWTGNDDLELFVQTPSGIIVSASNPYDPASGAVFGEPSLQSGFGRFVENVYFPFGVGPTGIYTYYVKSTRAQGSNDFWEVSVSVGGGTQATQRGSGDSGFFTFDFAGGGSFPTPTPIASECTVDDDCPVGEECVQDNCVGSGNPRVTLSWVGDDDLDLYVITPNGSTISFANPLDALSSGRFGGNGVQTTFSRHFENIYFPQDAPSGTYTFYVRTYIVRSANDLWTVEANVNGQSVVSKSGQGDSESFSFLLGPSSPTSSPVDEFCQIGVDECCTDNQCLPNEVCTQRTCINDGNPRFTLTWTGDDDLDLVVVTPLDTVVSFLNNVDGPTGGRFGDGGNQFGFGLHVENIFFPPVRAPIGTYQFYVRSFLPVSFDDEWKVEVYVNEQVVSSTTGTGSSEMLTYNFQGNVPTIPTSPPVSSPTIMPQVPPTPEPVCNRAEDECCSDSDCIASVENCVQAQCIDLGNPRFTLTWTGDDDLDLMVATPFGARISFVNPADSRSGGIFGEEGSQFVFDRHVENVYFTDSAADSGSVPIGVYTYSVESFLQRGSNDRWTVSVFVDNILVATQTGFGDSAEFSYDFQGSTIAFSQPLPVGCDPSLVECCEDSDCLDQQEICVQETCIDRGNPRFTLTWTGDDDFDLAVVTPFGTTIGISSPEDELSGGKFGEEGDQLTFGLHVENIYLPLSGGPSGTYTYFISSYDQVGTPDTWFVTVYVDDEPVITRTGQGVSDFFVFEYEDGFDISTNSTSETPQSSLNTNTTSDVLMPLLVQDLVTCKSEEEECCNDDDCPLDNTLCVQRICITEGNPRFTLTWNGNDDYQLSVLTPLGGNISYIDQIDKESGGQFGDGGIQPFVGLHTENIFFPMEGGPIGTYQFQVTPDRIRDDEDGWTVTIYSHGQEIESISGRGLSDKISFVYEDGSILETTMAQECSIVKDECCSNEDCLVELDIVSLCVQRTCIPEGDLRFVLSWTGEDDLDLTVATPSGTALSIFNQGDDVSNGIFVKSKSGFGYRPQMESVVFLKSGLTTSAPIGKYKYQVSSFNAIGQDDRWLVQVYLGGMEVAKHTGLGDSGEFTFDLSDSAASLRSITNAGDNSHLTLRSSALTDNLAPMDTCQDCSSQKQLCLASTCLSSGKLHFTLWWTGSEEDLVLSVWPPTPEAEVLSSGMLTANTNIAEWEAFPKGSGESLYHLVFTQSPPGGRYRYSITSPEGLAAALEWKLWIHRGDEEVDVKTGSSLGSSFFFYDFKEIETKL